MTKTIKLLSILITAAVILFSSACCKVKPAGRTTTETRSYASTFNQIECHDVNVNIQKDTTQSVYIIADANLMSKIETIVTNGKLIIKRKTNTLYVDVPDPSVTISCQTINLLKTNNPGGTTKLSGFQNLNKLDIENVNDGNIELNGSTDKLNITCEGNGYIYGYNFTAKNCNIEHDGDKDTRITVTDYLSGTLKNDGNIAYKGNPTVNVKVTGSGRIIDAN